MAGAPPNPFDAYDTPYEMPDPYAVPELTFEQEVDRDTQRTMREIEAYTLLGNDFDVPLAEDYTPPAVERDENYVPPQTLEDARERVQATKAQLEAYRKQIEDYAEETRGLLPMDDRSTGEIIERANIIARARRDILSNLEQITEAEKQLAEVELAGTEDPGFWQKALGVATDALGIAEPVLQFLMAPQEIISGRASQAAELASPEMFSVELSLADRVGGLTDIAAMFNPDSPIRRRGREFSTAVGRSVTALENIMLDTPVLAQVGMLGPAGALSLHARKFFGEGIERAGLAKPGEGRDLMTSFAFDMATDPLMVLDAGPVTRTGKLRELSRVGAGVLDKAALKKTLDELPELTRALGSIDEAYDAANTGDIVTRLRIRGASPDEAAELAKRFDAERVRNLTNLRKMASNDPMEFAAAGREALEAITPASKAEQAGQARQMEYLNRIHEFGRAGDKNFIDPIIGRSWYEQAMIGQRLAAMQPIIRRFGDKPWLQNTIRYGTRPWMSITGTSLKHDISDKAELLELYYMQQLRRMDMGAEFHRYEADVAKRAANILNGLNEQQSLQVQEAAIPLVEKIKRGKRMVEAGKAFPDDDGLANAAYQYAKWYEFDAGTARAIENRFNFRVAELSGDLGYFGREFSDELQAKIFNNKKARDWLWGEKARRGLDNISTAWLGYEKQRKYKALDFFESEAELRDGLRRAGLNIADDEILWKRDGFDILSKRLKKSQNIAERRGLVYGWADAAGTTDAAKLDIAKGILDEAGTIRATRAVEGVIEAGSKVDAATGARADFEAGRTAVRQAGKAAAREATQIPPGAAQIEQVAASPGTVAQGARDAAAAAKGAQFPIDEVVRVTERMADDVARDIRRVADDVEEFAGFHGTVRDFDAINIDAPRVAIMDKPGRGQVRGAFFSPDPDVGANYIAVTFPKVAEQLGKQPTLYGWQTLTNDFASAGLDPDRWAKRIADLAFGKQPKVFAWVRDAIDRLMGKIPKGVTVHTGKAIDGQRVFEVGRDQRQWLEGVLGRAAREEDGIRNLGISITKHGEGIRPRVLKQSFRGKTIDLVNPRKWPEALTTALRAGTHKDDVRVAKRLAHAQATGKWQGMDVIERSPALNKWLDDNGYQIVKKPEYDDITGEFSYWVRDQKALVPAGKEGTTLSRDVRKRAEKALDKFRVATRDTASVTDVRRALTELKRELRAIAPPKLADDYTRRADDAIKQLDRLDAAQAAVAKPVAAAVRKQESQALKNLEKAQERMANADVTAMSPEAKAQWVQSTLTREGVRPAPGNVSALEVMQKSKIPMPDDLDELARLHVTEFTPNQAEEFRRLHDKLYWKDMTPDGILDNIAKVVIDYPKAVFQGTVLSRWASLSKDLIGNAINLAMNPRTVPYFATALKDAWKAWRAGEFADDVAELQAIGVLRTSRQEVLEGGSEIAKLIPGQVGLAAERVGKMGPVAGSIKTLDKAVTRAANAVGIKLKEGKKLAESVAAYRDFKLQARQIFEEAGRIATYREAIARGYSKLEAVEEVYKWWGRFDELTKLEKTVMNRILFFWSWMVRSVPVALRHLVEHPMRSKLVLSLLAGDVTDDEKMPPWLRRMGGWVLGDDGNGNVRAMSTMSSSWFSPLFSALQGEAANRMMNGQPWEAATIAYKDVLRSAPPHMQGMYELGTEYDLFTQKPWWQDRNAKVGSNAKAPTALWWFYGDNALSNTLGLKATGKSGEPQYLTMDPRWSWFFGMMPGVETTLGDVSAFFRPSETSEIVPEIDIIKGSMRTVGIPIYDVPMETGGRQLYDFRNALLKESSRLSGNALSSYNRRITPSALTTRGREITAFKDRARKHGMSQLGMSAAQAERYALNQMAGRYPDEFRILDLQYRLERWEDHLKRAEDGHAELTETLQSRIELLQRRGAVDRLAKEELKRTLELYKELGLAPAKAPAERKKIGLAEAREKERKRRVNLVR